MKNIILPIIILCTSCITHCMELPIDPFDAPFDFQHYEHEPIIKLPQLVTSSIKRPTPAHLIMPTLKGFDRTQIAEKLYVMIEHDRHDELKLWFDQTTTERFTFKNNLGLLKLLNAITYRQSSKKTATVLETLIDEYYYPGIRLLPGYILTNDDLIQCIANLLKNN